MKQTTLLHRLVPALAATPAGSTVVGARLGTAPSIESGTSAWRHGLLLAGLIPLLAAGTAWAEGERPRPENYANYSLYIQALVDYQRAQETAAKAAPKKSGASKLCRDDQGEKSSEKKKSSCEGKYLLVEDLIPEENERNTPQDDLDPTSGNSGDELGDSPDPYAAGSDNGPGSDPLAGSSSGDGSHESVEDVIARAGYRQEAPNINSGNPEQRPMYSGIPMAEISVQDLSDAGIEGLLGLVENARIKGVTGGSGSGFVVGLGGPYGGGSSIVRGTGDGSDGSITAVLENYQITFYQPGILNLDNFSLLSNGYSIVNATVSVAGNDSVDIDLSSETRMQLWVVDRDGLPESDFAGAGAIEFDELGVIVPRLEVNIQGARSSSGEGLMRINAYSPTPIYADLRNTEIGVADALRDGSRIGTASTFLRFGPTSILTIAPGTSVRVDISEPNGLSAPFVTLNGRVGDVSIDDIRILDNDDGGSIRIGRLGVRGLNFVDAKIFLDDAMVVVDAGRGITNLGLDIERLSIGNDVSQTIIGDFYARGGELQHLRMTAEPH
jgi:hypothetical protein